VSYSQNNINVSPNALKYIQTQPAVATAATVPVCNVQPAHSSYPAYMQPQLYQQSPYSFVDTQKIFGKHDAYFYQLPNGQKVVVVPKKGPTVIKTYVNVGSMNEPDNLRGISHFIEHNLFNGTDHLKPGEFFKKVSGMGANTNASTSFAVTDYFIESQLLDTKDLEEEIKLHADMIQYPAFAEAMLEKERGPVISEISMVSDNPMNQAVNKCIKNLLNIKSASDEIIAGRVDNIAKVTQKDVRDYYNTWYTPDRMTTVITGEVEPSQVMALIAANFTKQASPNLKNRRHEPLNPIQSPVRVDMTSPHSSGVQIMLGFAGPANNANTKDQLAMEALTLLLNADANARLNRALEPLSASVSAGTETISNLPDEPSVILFQVNCNPENTEKVLQTIYDEIHKISNQPPDSSEFRFVKNRMKRACNEISESSALLNNAVGGCVRQGNLDYLLNAGRLIDFITPEEVSAAARKYLDLNKISISAVHPDLKTQASQPLKGNAPSFGAAVYKSAYDPSAVQQYRLPNNMEVVFLPENTEYGTVALHFTDTSNLNYKPGTNLILMKMLEDGSAFRKKTDFYNFARENDIAFDFKYETGFTAAAAKFPLASTQTAFDMLREVLLNPNMSKESFEKAKANVKNQLLRAQKSASHKLQKALFPNNVRGHNLEDILGSIDNITIDDVKALHESCFKNGDGKLLMSAPSEYSQTAIRSGMQYPQLRPLQTEPKQIYTPVEKPLLLTEAEKRNQAEIIKAYKFKISNNLKDRVTFELLNLILGGTTNSHLFNDLRERQKLAYRVRSNISSVEDTGIMNLSILTTTDNPDEGDKLDNVNKAIAGFNKHTDKMKAELVSQEELDIAKKTAKNNILNGAENAQGKLVQLGMSKSSPYGIDMMNQYLDIIDSVTPQDILAAANYVFAGPSITSILASERTLQAIRQ